VDARDVTRVIRRIVWPALRPEGFDAFTGRTAWRYVGDAVDVVNFQSFGASVADAVGCTTFSFSVNLGVCLPQDGPARLRPAVYECVPHRRRLEKSLAQPWFQPFRGDTRRWPLSLRLHREGLRKVLRSDTHDRRDTWFVKPDGSNVEECIEDALRALREEGLPWFEATRAKSHAEAP
jgi:Domain of unknown function (DUF4304)